MLDRPLKGLRNVKKALENSVTEFSVPELGRDKSPGIFCSDRKKSWNFLKKIFLEFREKMEFLEFSGPRIFLSWNVLSGNFLPRDFVSRKILAFLNNYVIIIWFYKELRIFCKFGTLISWKKWKLGSIIAISSANSTEHSSIYHECQIQSAPRFLLSHETGLLKKIPTITP